MSAQVDSPSASADSLAAILARINSRSNSPPRTSEPPVAPPPDLNHSTAAAAAAALTFPPDGSALPRPASRNSSPSRSAGELRAAASPTLPPSGSSRPGSSHGSPKHSERPDGAPTGLVFGKPPTPTQGLGASPLERPPSGRQELPAAQSQEAASRGASRASARSDRSKTGSYSSEQELAQVFRLVDDAGAAAIPGASATGFRLDMRSGSSTPQAAAGGLLDSDSLDRFELRTVSQASSEQRVRKNEDAFEIAIARSRDSPSGSAAGGVSVGGSRSRQSPVPIFDPSTLLQAPLPHSNSNSNSATPKAMASGSPPLESLAGPQPHLRQSLIPVRTSPLSSTQSSPVHMTSVRIQYTCLVYRGRRKLSPSVNFPMPLLSCADVLMCSGQRAAAASGERVRTREPDARALRLSLRRLDGAQLADSDARHSLSDAR